MPGNWLEAAKSQAAWVALHRPCQPLQARRFRAAVPVKGSQGATAFQLPSGCLQNKYREFPDAVFALL